MHTMRVAMHTVVRFNNAHNAPSNVHGAPSNVHGARSNAHGAHLEGEKHQRGDRLVVVLDERLRGLIEGETPTVVVHCNALNNVYNSGPAQSRD